MGPYGPILAHVGPILAHVGPYGMGPYGSMWAHIAHMGPMWAHMTHVGGLTPPAMLPVLNQVSNTQMTPARDPKQGLWGIYREYSGEIPNPPKSNIFDIRLRYGRTQRMENVPMRISTC